MSGWVGGVGGWCHTDYYKTNLSSQLDWHWPTGTELGKNDFVFTCKKYLGILKMKTTFEEIAEMSKFKCTQILKEKTKYEALIFLKSQQIKQEKRQNIVY